MRYVNYIFTLLLYFALFIYSSKLANDCKTVGKKEDFRKLNLISDSDEVDSQLKLY